jgi:hypothetical protein
MMKPTAYSLPSIERDSRNRGVLKVHATSNNFLDGLLLLTIDDDDDNNNDNNDDEYDTGVADGADNSTRSPSRAGRIVGGQNYWEDVGYFRVGWQSAKARHDGRVFAVHPGEKMLCALPFR